MRCKECGTILLDSDTFCGKCGAKIQPNICPECGETLRPGMRFCSNCGFEVIGAEEYEEYNDSADDDIPVTGGLKTTEIPFELIEQSIIRDVERQLDVPVVDNSVKNTDNEPRIFSTFPNQSFVENESYREDMYDSYENSGDYDEYADEYDNYEDEGYEDEGYEDDGYVDDEYEYDDRSSVGSRILIAGMIVIALVFLLIVAALFFKNRKNNNEDNNPTIEENTDDENSNDENSEEAQSDSDKKVIGTITIVKNVNIRSAADSSDDSNKIGMALAGDTYAYYGFAENSDNWVHIKVNDKTDGYVYKDYIKINE